MDMNIELFGSTWNLLYILPIIFIYMMIVTSTCCGCMSINVPYVEGFQPMGNISPQELIYKPKEQSIVEPIPFEVPVKSAADVPNYHCATCHTF
jgi:hypothetical protein